MEAGIAAPTSLQPCGVCGRRFNLDVLDRHEKICMKTAESSKKRKPFDSSKMRAMGTELQNMQNVTPGTVKSQMLAEKAAAKKKDWKRKHEEFIQSIRAARSVTNGQPLPQYTPSAPNPDYVQCPYCERRFQEESAQRHIPFCKEKSQRINQTPVSSSAKEKADRRKQYKPPSLKKKPAGDAPAARPPPGSSVVMKQTNFGSTYTVNQSDAPPPGHARSNRQQGNVVVAHTSSRKATPSKGPVRNTSFSAAPSEETPVTHITVGDARMKKNLRMRSDSLESLSDNSSQGEPVFHGSKGIRQKRLQQTSDFDDYSISSKSSSPQFNSAVHVAKSGYSNMSGPPQNSWIQDPPPRMQSSSRKEPLSEHGMPMSKYCYECGTKYPVPQAKYCCMCGTKRL